MKWTSCPGDQCHSTSDRKPKDKTTLTTGMLRLALLEKTNLFSGRPASHNVLEFFLLLWIDSNRMQNMNFVLCFHHQIASAFRSHKWSRTNGPGSPCLLPARNTAGSRQGQGWAGDQKVSALPGWPGCHRVAPHESVPLTVTGITGVRVAGRGNLTRACSVHEPILMILPSQSL
jgi:hypothetical protein